MRYKGKLLVLCQLHITSCHRFVPQKLFRVSTLKTYKTIYLCESLLLKGRFPKKKKVFKWIITPKFICWRILLFLQLGLTCLNYLMSLHYVLGHFRPGMARLVPILQIVKVKFRKLIVWSPKQWENCLWNLYLLCLRPELNFTIMPWSFCFQIYFY